MKTFEPKCGGAWPTMITPFDEGGRIDWGAYRAMIAWYLEHGVGGLYANCLSSEMYALDDEERLRLASEAVAIAGGKVRVAATGNLGETPAEHLALCRRMADTGVDIVMLLVPPFLGNDEALKDYYLALAEQLEAPLGLYECPVPRRYHLGLELIGELARSGRFVAFKETSEDLDKILAVQRLTQDTALSLLQACNPYLLDAVRAGGLGSMTIAAIHLPDLVAAVIDKGRAGDPDAERLQGALCAMYLAQRAAHPQGAKYLLGKRGLPITARCRPPHAPLKAETMRAFDYAAGQWFTADGELRVLAG